MSTNEKKVDRPPLSELKGVQYTGTAQVRLMTREDWKAAGVSGVDQDVEWSTMNDYFVAVDQMNAAAIDLLATQDDFRLVHG